MPGRTASSSDSLLAEANVRRSVHSPRDYFIITLIISDRRGTRASGLWLGTRTGAGGKATLA
jgi:hypothetical protein